MYKNLSLVVHSHLSLSEIIDILEGDNLSVNAIFVTSPDAFAHSDEDSAPEDDGGEVENLSCQPPT